MRIAITRMFGVARSQRKSGIDVRGISRVAMILTVGVTHIALGQGDTVRIPYRISCATCRMDFVEVVTLGKPADPLLISSKSNVVRNSRGQYFAASYNAQQIVVFDSTGRFLTAVGRAGRGPGEFEPAGFKALQIGPRDSLFVQTQRSIMVFNANLEFVRSFKVADSPQSRLTSRGGTIVSGPLGLPASAGYDFHELNATGNHVRSFGNHRRDIVPGEPPQVPILFALSRGEDALWAALLDQYVLGKFKLGQNQATVFSVDGAKYVPAGRNALPALLDRSVAAKVQFERELLALPPRAYMQVLGEDRTGLVWVVWRVPTTNGSPYRQVLELVDPMRRQIVLSQPLERAVKFVPGTDFVSISRSDQDGVISITIARPSIRQE